MDTVIELREADIPRVVSASSRPVLEQVDWPVQRGEFWVVGALPAAGKTDLLCAAAGLVRPIRGTQCLFGRELSEMSEDELVQTRLRIAMVFTGGRLFNSLTVAQNIALPLSYHKQYDEQERIGRVTEALEKTGLSALQDRRPTQIASGLHQRVGLARALALEPEVLLVDNPLSGIDPRQGRWWIDFLCGVKKTLTVVVAADDLRAWMDVGDQFAVVRERKLEIVGGRERLRGSADPVVRELLRPAFEEP